MPRKKKVWPEDLDAKIEDEAIRETEEVDWRVEAAMKRLMPDMPLSESYETVRQRLRYHRNLILVEEVAYQAHQAAIKGKRARPQEKDVPAAEKLLP